MAALLTAPIAYIPANVTASSTYVLFLIDIDVPHQGNKVPLLHWLAPNLVAQSQLLVRDNAVTNASTSIGAGYIPPTHPANSGAHRYTFVLFEQPGNWAIPSAYASINPPANTTARIGFNITDFVAQSGLKSPIAANYLRVLNGTAAETSSASTMTMASATATSSGVASSTPGGAQGSGSLIPSVVASATSLIESGTPTGGGMVCKSNGEEMMAGVATAAVVGAAAWVR